jgi:small GTP-binding protein
MIAPARTEITDILSEQQERIRDAEREALVRLQDTIRPLEPDERDREAISQAVEDLEELFLLVIVGEFNSGKSTLINAMLEADVLPEGVTPTTASINLLRHGEHAGERPITDFVVERTYPADFLRDISIVDTPGTNAIIRRHEELTRNFVPRSDLVIFITSADRPFTESERGFMETIREWGKKIVVVLNKIDILQSQEELERVLNFIEDNSVMLLGQKPEIFPVSARMARKARASDDPEQAQQLFKASRMDRLEQYIFNTLDEASRIRLKLSTPLGIAGRIIEKYRDVARDRLAVLADDARTVETIEADMALYAQDMKSEFSNRVARIENIIYELKERGDQFFEDTIRAGRIRDLLNSDKIQREFEDRVVSDTARKVDDATSGLIDWMVDRDLRQWQRVQEYLDRRRQAGYSAQAIGNLTGQFAYHRESLIKSVAQEARRIVESYDRRQEAAEIAQDMRSAVGQVIVAGSVAGLGVLVSLAISAAFIDITGITAALVSGTVGLFILPYRKRKAQEEFRQRTQELKDKLITSMTQQFEVELEQSLDRIRDAIAPYTRFVRMEQDRVGTADTSLAQIEQNLTSIRAQVEAIGRQA